MTFRNETTAATTKTTKRNRVRMALMGGAVVVLPVAGLVTATSASAASTSTWDAVAQCESTGNWSINSGNGFSGGLQFTPSTWAAYGGTQYAPAAYQATEGQQIAIAEKVLADQGPGAWPVCSVKAGLTKGGAAAQVDTSSSSSSSSAAASRSETRAQLPKAVATPTPKAATAAPKTAAAPAPKAATPAPKKAVAPKQTAAPKPAKAPAAPVKHTNGGTYTVKAGDTLSQIAASKGLDWKTLYSHNTGVIGGNADVIFPGQVLSI